MRSQTAKVYWACTSSGRIEIRLTLEQAEAGSHSGDCEPDILELRQDPDIKAQLDTIDPGVLREELSEYGAWEDEELQDHDLNLSRILWLMCGDIVEEAGA